MAAASAGVMMRGVFALVLLSCCVSLASACVPPDCLYVTDSPRRYYAIDDPWIIFALVLACFFFIVIIIILLWLCCYCCFSDVEGTPNIIRRIFVIKRPVVQKKQVQVKKEKKLIQQKPLLHVLPPPPLPPPPPPIAICPSEPVVVVPPCQPCNVPCKPKSLLFTVSEGLNASLASPDMATKVECPLTFTITPEYTVHQSNYVGPSSRIVDISSSYKDYESCEHNHGCGGQHDACTSAHCGNCGRPTL